MPVENPTAEEMPRLLFNSSGISLETNQRNPSHNVSCRPVAFSVFISAPVISLAVTSNADGKPADEAS